MNSGFQFPDLRQETDRFVNHVSRTCNHLRNEASKLESRTKEALHSAITRSHRLVHPDRGNPSLNRAHKFAVVSFGRLFNWGDKKKKKCKVTRPSLEKLSDPKILKRLTPEQRKKLDEKVVWNLLHKRDYNFKGKKLTANQLMKAIDEELVKLQRSVDINTYKDIDNHPEYLGLIESLPANFVRKDAPKQQHPRREERKLELTRITSGVCDKGLFGGNQFSFGIFARERELAKHMIRWMNSDPKKTARDGEFFGDLMKVHQDIELTLMVVPSKPLSIRKLQWEYAQKLTNSMWDLFGVKKPWKPLVEFIGLFNVDRIASSEWVEGSKILPDTQLFFTTIKDGNLFVDAINPGPLKDQKTTLIGVTLSPLIATGVFSLFLGRHPIDREAKELFVRSVIHLAKGYPADPPKIDWRVVDKESLINKNKIPVEKRFALSKPVAKKAPTRLKGSQR